MNIFPICLDINLFPHWIPSEPSGVQSSLYVHMSWCLFVFLFCRLRRFLVIICATCNCAQRMRLQATVSNPLSVSIIRPSVRPSCHPQAFCDFCICINFQCGGPASWCISPVGSSRAYISISLSSRPRHLLEIIHAACNCAQRMPPHATGSNPLSGCIIYLPVCLSTRLSVRPSICPVACGPFSIFVFVIISSVGALILP